MPEEEREQKNNDYMKAGGTEQSGRLLLSAKEVDSRNHSIF